MNKHNYIKIYLTNRNNADSLAILEEMKKLAQTDDDFAQRFNGWLDSELSTIVLRELVETVTGKRYFFSLDHQNNVDSLDSASYSYKCSSYYSPTVK